MLNSIIFKVILMLYLFPYGPVELEKSQISNAAK